MVEKTHANLLKDIRRYYKQLGEVKIDFTEFFIESSYITEQGKELPCYNITKKDCEFIANKLTGVKGTEFTAKYIKRFHEMENRLNQTGLANDFLQIQNQPILEINMKVDNVMREWKDFKQEVQGEGKMIYGTIPYKIINSTPCEYVLAGYENRVVPIVTQKRNRVDKVEMSYPIKEDRIVDIIREYMESKTGVFTMYEEIFVRELTRMLNKAYATGVKKS